MIRENDNADSMSSVDVIDESAGDVADLEAAQWQDDGATPLDEAKCKIVGHQKGVGKVNTAPQPMTWDALVRHIWFGCYHRSNLAAPDEGWTGSLPIPFTDPRGHQAFKQVVAAVSSLRPVTTDMKEHEDAVRNAIEAQLTAWSNDVSCVSQLVQDGVYKKGQPKMVTRWITKDVDIAILAYLWPRILNTVSGFGIAEMYGNLEKTALEFQAALLEIISSSRKNYDPQKNTKLADQFLWKSLKKALPRIRNRKLSNLSYLADRIYPAYRDSCQVDHSGKESAFDIAKKVALRLCNCKAEHDRLQDLIDVYDKEAKFPSKEICAQAFCHFTKEGKPALKMSKDLLGKPLRDLYDSASQSKHAVSRDDLLQALATRIEPLVCEIIQKTQGKALPRQVEDEESEHPTAILDKRMGSDANDALPFENRTVTVEGALDERASHPNLSHPPDVEEDGEQVSNVMAFCETIAYLWREKENRQCLVALFLHKTGGVSDANIVSLTGISACGIQEALIKAIDLLREWHPQLDTHETPTEPAQQAEIHLWLHGVNKMVVFLLHTDDLFHVNQKGTPKCLAKWLGMTENGVRAWIKEMTELKLRYERKFSFLRNNVDDMNDSPY